MDMKMHSNLEKIMSEYTVWNQRTLELIKFQ